MFIGHMFCDSHPIVTFLCSYSSIQTNMMINTGNLWFHWTRTIEFIFFHQFELWFQWSMTWCDHIIDVIFRTSRGSTEQYDNKSCLLFLLVKSVNFNFFLPVLFRFRMRFVYVYLLNSTFRNWESRMRINYHFTYFNPCVISQANILCNRMCFFSSSSSLKLSIARSLCVHIASKFIQFGFRWCLTSILWQVEYVVVLGRAYFNRQFYRYILVKPGRRNFLISVDSDPFWKQCSISLHLYK